MARTFTFLLGAGALSLAFGLAACGPRATTLDSGPPAVPVTGNAERVLVIYAIDNPSPEKLMPAVASHFQRCAVPARQVPLRYAYDAFNPPNMGEVHKEGKAQSGDFRPDAALTIIQTGAIKDPASGRRILTEYRAAMFDTQGREMWGKAFRLTGSMWGESSGVFAREIFQALEGERVLRGCQPERQ